LSGPSNILVTGANGFIGKNLTIRLKELLNIEVMSFTREQSLNDLSRLASRADIIFHLAGVNRSDDLNEFKVINTELTSNICEIIKSSGRKTSLVFASSVQAELNNPYGKSKLDAESIVTRFAKNSGNSVHIYRFPGVFGKWCRPNYNSVVATFCHNIARSMPIQIDNPNTILNLLHIDDVIEEFISVLRSPKKGLNIGSIKKNYKISVGALADQIYSFENGRKNLLIENVGTGLIRALYSTYISYLPPESFSYDLPLYKDSRGVFVEILKTLNSGQFSIFTVYPGVTRGSHYHHTKTEKFLIVKGVALMKFRNLLTDQICSIYISADKMQIVDSIPGWVHDITNIGNEEAIIMIWANEIFDRQFPDCIPRKV